MVAQISPSQSGALADVVLVLHIAVFAFVVLGQVAIIAGGVFGVRWVRDLRFRIVHLVLIVFIACQTSLGQHCPLTTLERDLRIRAGRSAYYESFTQHWFSHILFFDAPIWFFTALHTLAAFVVIASWVWIRPKGTIRRL